MEDVEDYIRIVVPCVFTKSDYTERTKQEWAKLMEAMLINLVDCVVDLSIEELNRKQWKNKETV